MAIDYADLVFKLAQLPRETEWLEFKVDNDDPQEIGRLLSALSNSAALHGKDRAFIVWGIKDGTHEIVGTKFQPQLQRICQQELENWLTTHLNPQTQFWIREADADGKRCVIFEVEPASHRPVAFKGEEYIRVGSYLKPLRAHHEKEKALWRCLSRGSFESGVAAYDLSTNEALGELDTRAYLRLSEQAMPDSDNALVDRLCEDLLLKRNDGGRIDITNLGALLFARDLRRFPDLKRKTTRLIFYKGFNRTESQKEVEGQKGYASGFSGLITFLVKSLPQSEEIRRSLRIVAPRYPEIALRELVANALVHQDFDISGTGPMIEVFEDRVEITNPGMPLIDVRRFLDLPPRSRNEKLAHLMRRLRICEERGSGIDKVLTAVEVFQLPAPDFQVAGDHTKAILLGPRGFSDMTKDERIRACYQHAGLQWVTNRQMTNESLRKRFGFTDANMAMATRIISDTLAVSLIKQYDPTNTSKRHSRYVPFWA